MKTQIFHKMKYDLKGVLCYGKVTFLLPDFDTTLSYVLMETFFLVFVAYLYCYFFYPICYLLEIDNQKIFLIFLFKLLNICETQENAHCPGYKDQFLAGLEASGIQMNIHPSNNLYIYLPIYLSLHLSMYLLLSR